MGLFIVVAIGPDEGVMPSVPIRAPAIPAHLCEQSSVQSDVFCENLVAQRGDDGLGRQQLWKSLGYARCAARAAALECAMFSAAIRTEHVNG